MKDFLSLSEIDLNLINIYRTKVSGDIIKGQDFEKIFKQSLHCTTDTNIKIESLIFNDNNTPKKGVFFVSNHEEALSLKILLHDLFISKENNNYNMDKIHIYTTESEKDISNSNKIENPIKDLYDDKIDILIVCRLLDNYPDSDNYMEKVDYMFSFVRKPTITSFLKRFLILLKSIKKNSTKKRDIFILTPINEKNSEKEQDILENFLINFNNTGKKEIKIEDKTSKKTEQHPNKINPTTDIDNVVQVNIPQDKYPLVQAANNSNIGPEDQEIITPNNNGNKIQYVLNSFFSIESHLFFFSVKKTISSRIDQFFTYFFLLLLEHHKKIEKQNQKSDEEFFENYIEKTMYTINNLSNNNKEILNNIFFDFFLIQHILKIFNLDKNITLKGLNLEKHSKKQEEIYSNINNDSKRYTNFFIFLNLLSRNLDQSTKKFYLPSKQNPIQNKNNVTTFIIPILYHEDENLTNYLKNNYLKKGNEIINELTTHSKIFNTNQIIINFHEILFVKNSQEKIFKPAFLIDSKSIQTFLNNKHEYFSIFKIIKYNNSHYIQLNITSHKIKEFLNTDNVLSKTILSLLSEILKN